MTKNDQSLFNSIYFLSSLHFVIKIRKDDITKAEYLENTMNAKHCMPHETVHRYNVFSHRKKWLKPIVQNKCQVLLRFEYISNEWELYQNIYSILGNYAIIHVIFLLFCYKQNQPQHKRNKRQIKYLSYSNVNKGYALFILH